MPPYLISSDQCIPLPLPLGGDKFMDWVVGWGTVSCPVLTTRIFRVSPGA